MNATHQKYADQGLVVLGVSSESGSQLKPFVEKFKTEYPVVGATRAGSHYGVRAYPTYYLVSPSGRILAGPTHGKFSDDVLKSALRSVVLFPEVPESSRLASLAKASAKADVAEVSKVLARLVGNAELSAEEKSCVVATQSALTRILKVTSEEVQELGQGPDYYASQLRLREIAKTFSGLPVESEADAQLDRFRKDSVIKKELSAMKRLMAIRKKFNPTKISDRRKMKKALFKLEGKIRGTYAETKTQKLLQTLGD